MTTLDRKLWRDLKRLKGQTSAIVLVIASGVACFIMFLSTLDSLLESRELYYRDYRFADAFASLERAPESLRARLEAIPGVATVNTRIVAPLTIDLKGFPEPITGLITSLADHETSELNRLYIHAGRLPTESRADEVLISEAFASAHNMGPGERLPIILKGKRIELRIVGVGSSPEHIHQLRRGGMFPDFERYGILWMARTPLASAYDMENAFNDVVVSLSRKANTQNVLDAMDDVLKRYGAIGAYARVDQNSHRFLNEEINQLRSLSGVFPILFLGVAAFLLNAVVMRLVSTQREQIAALKAFGYDNTTVAIHYLKMILVVVAVGIIIGTVTGTWLGHRLSQIYAEFFRLPILSFELDAVRIGQASVLTVAAGLVGTVAAVRTAVRLRPAEAMRPEVPIGYRQTLIERLGLQAVLSAPSRMILRQISGNPIRSLLSVLGIAFACAILMTGRFQKDTVSFMMDVHYGVTQREDLSVVFSEPTSGRAVLEVNSLPGVEHVEAYRVVPARLRYEHRSYRTYVQGFDPNGKLRRLVDTDLQSVRLPESGIVLNEYLATEILGVRPGQLLTVEILEGEQAIRQVPVVGLIRQFLGVGAYMSLEALNRVMHEGRVVSGAYLYVDASRADKVYEALKDRPGVVGSIVRTQEIKNFNRTLNETMLFWTYIATIFATVIAVGVVYNGARITLTERSRELASLRVLGYTRGEISYILLGEIAILTLLAIPIGLLLGHAFCGYIAISISNELYRVPLILESPTYAFAALVVMLASAASGLVVRRRLDRLDLIQAIKTKE